MKAAIIGGIFGGLVGLLGVLLGEYLIQSREKRKLLNEKREQIMFSVIDIQRNFDDLHTEILNYVETCTLSTSSDKRYSKLADINVYIVLLQERTKMNTLIDIYEPELYKYFYPYIKGIDNYSKYANEILSIPIIRYEESTATKLRALYTNALIEFGNLEGSIGKIFKKGEIKSNYPGDKTE